VTRARSAAWLLRTRGRRGAAGTRILFYHRVADDGDVLAVSRAAFAAQMRLLARAGFGVVELAELSRRLAAGDDDPALLGLSFDDGYLDVAENAAPILAEHGFTASVFVATEVTSGRAAFTWYERQPPLISWDLMRSLDREGPLRFEAHTRTHPNLLRVDDARASEEIVGGKVELEQQLGRAVDVFCYPAGLFGERERGLAATAGFRAAVSCEPGVNTRETDPFALRRIQVDARDSLLDVRAKVSGGHDTPLRLRTAWRRARYA